MPCCGGFRGAFHRSFPQSAVETLAENIVFLKAQYGVSNGTTPQIEQWVAATDAWAPPKRNKTGLSGPSASKPGHPGKGVLMRFGKDGVPEKMLEDNETHYVTLGGR